MSGRQIVIIGGGFGGLAAATALRRQRKDRILLLDRNNTHLFQPLLYQVASGALSPSNIASPLRALLRRQRNIQCLQTTVRAVNAEEHEVTTDHGGISYDKLIVASGMQTSYFGNDQWRHYTYALKSNEEALVMRSDILSRFEEAAWCTDSEERRRLLTFVIIGGGPTGVEMAGTIADLAHRSLYDQFNYDTSTAEILLLEASPRILETFPAGLSLRASRDLQQLGVDVRCNSMANEINADTVAWTCADEQLQRNGALVIWAAGVTAGSFGRYLAEQLNAATDMQGRLHVDEQLRLAEYPDVHIIGDLAHTPAACSQSGEPAPATAQAAIQMGEFAGALLAGRSEQNFRFINKGSMAIIGSRRAIAVIGRWQLTGSSAWVVWLLVHILQLAEFQNRLLVFTRWVIHYICWRRSARIILDEETMACAGSLRRRRRARCARRSSSQGERSDAAADNKHA